MFFIDKNSFESTLSLLKGETVLSPMFTELKQFMEEEFELTIYNISFEKFSRFTKPKKNSLAFGKKYRLIFQVASISERESMQNKIPVELPNQHQGFRLENDEYKQGKVLTKFLELSKKYSFETRIKENEIWIDYFYWFLIDYKSYIVECINKEFSEEIISRYKTNAGIWKILKNGSGMIVFYQTEEQKALNEQNGVSKRITDEYYSMIKKTDEINLCQKNMLIFDTKENLDKNYGGSLYTYMR